MTTNFYTDLAPITTDIQPTISVSDTINTISSEITNTLTTHTNSIEDNDNDKYNDNDNDISIITDTRSSVYNVLTTSSITTTSSLSTNQLSSTAHKEVSSNNGNGNKANNYKKSTLVWGILGTSLLYSFIL